MNGHRVRAECVVDELEQKFGELRGASHDVALGQVEFDRVRLDELHFPFERLQATIVAALQTLFDRVQVDRVRDLDRVVRELVQIDRVVEMFRNRELSNRFQALFLKKHTHFLITRSFNILTFCLISVRVVNRFVNSLID